MEQRLFWGFSFNYFWHVNRAHQNDQEQLIDLLYCALFTSVVRSLQHYATQSSAISMVYNILIWSFGAIHDWRACRNLRLNYKILSCTNRLRGVRIHSSALCVDVFNLKFMWTMYFLPSLFLKHATKFDQNALSVFFSLLFRSRSVLFSSISMKTSKCTPIYIEYWTINSEINSVIDAANVPI